MYIGRTGVQRYRTYSTGEIVMMTFSFLLAALCVLAELLTAREDAGAAPYRSSAISTNRKDRDTAPLLAGDAVEMGYCKSWILRLLGAFRYALCTHTHTHAHTRAPIFARA